MKSILVVGGGIVGFAVALELQSRYPDLKILILEKEGRIAAHQTGHNSGVIHSGIYYKPGSLKAETCLEGAFLLHQFCDRHHIPRKRSGKVIVASHAGEIPALEQLYQQGIANRIQNIKMISRDELREIEPAVHALKAIHLPDVSLVDFQRVCETIRGEFAKKGGTVHLHQKVQAIRFSSHEVVAQTDRGEHTADYLVNCAGLYSDHIAEQAGCKIPARIIPFRGEYFLLREEIAKKIRGLVYPVPDPQFPFLGVHLTPTLKGEITVGPNAVLALAREGYSWKDVNLSEMADYLTYFGFWRMALKCWRTAMFELFRSFFKSIYATSVRNFLPDLKSSDLLSGGSGVRAQTVNENGEFIHDFLYLQQPRALHIVNAPSPAATASLAIAKRVVDKVPSTRL